MISVYAVEVEAGEARPGHRSLVESGLAAWPAHAIATATTELTETAADVEDWQPAAEDHRARAAC